MTQALNLGPINGHVVGRVLKEAVRRATVVIRSERAVFEVQEKKGYGGQMDDVCTSADRKAQEIYLRTLRECFPTCGIVAEEDSLAVSPQDGCTAYFTVDPLDGTKAYVRRQSHGVGTMVGLVDRGEVISAYVGDINTEETYGYRPGSHTVHRITRLDTFEAMDFRAPVDSRQSYVLLRDPLDQYSSMSQEFVRAKFKSHLVDGGSIGIWMARLWKREVGAVLLPPSWETPWDSTPVVGISRKLGYVFLKPVPDHETWERYTPSLMTTKYRREEDTLVIHENDLSAVGL